MRNFEAFLDQSGVRLCRAKRVTYAHLDLEDLERKLRETRANVKLIVTDGVFSMDSEVTFPKQELQVLELGPRSFVFVFLAPKELNIVIVFGISGESPSVENVNFISCQHR